MLVFMILVCASIAIAATTYLKLADVPDAKIRDCFGNEDNRRCAREWIKVTEKMSTSIRSSGIEDDEGRKRFLIEHHEEDMNEERDWAEIVARAMGYEGQVLEPLGDDTDRLKAFLNEA